jgi:hypothetical protein
MRQTRRRGWCAESHIAADVVDDANAFWYSEDCDSVQARKRYSHRSVLSAADGNQRTHAAPGIPRDQRDPAATLPEAEWKKVTMAKLPEPRRHWLKEAGSGDAGH